MSFCHLWAPFVIARQKGAEKDSYYDQPEKVAHKKLEKKLRAMHRPSIVCRLRRVFERLQVKMP